MKKHMRLIDKKDLPDVKTKIAMYSKASQILEKAGYKLYQILNLLTHFYEGFLRKN